MENSRLVETTYQDFLTGAFLHLVVLPLTSKLDDSVGTAEVVDRRAKPARSRTAMVRPSMMRAK